MMHQHPPGTGWIEVICGPMFSGKTEELIRRITRAQYAKQPVQIFKPAVDVRYDDTKVVSHNGREIDSTVINSGAEIFDHLKEDTLIVAIDEAQFLDLDTVRVAKDLAAEGRRVIVAGLDQDYQGKPFETLMHFLVEAEYITKNLSICLSCAAPAHRNQRLIEASGRLILGGTTEYEARCRNCFEPIKAEEGPLFEEA